MNNIVEGKTYTSLDLAKFCCALIIISAHFAAERGNFPPLVDYCFSIYLIAVPFFFTCSGFLIFDKLQNMTERNDQWQYVKKYILRIVVMYVSWSILYNVFTVYNYLMTGVTLERILHQLHFALVLTSYPTIWFLPALAIAVLCVFWGTRISSLKRILFVGCILYFLGSLGFSYAFLAQKIPGISQVLSLYNSIFLTTRNGIFDGIPFVALGGFIAVCSRRKDHILLWLGLTLVSGIFFIGEAFMLKFYDPTAPVDMILLLLPFEYCFMRFLLTWQIQPSWYFLVMRKLSLLIFVNQRLFLTALPSVLPAFLMAAICKNSYLGLTIILTASVSLAIGMLVLSKRWSWIKVFM